jgi:hypothetical protein
MACQLKTVQKGTELGESCELAPGEAGSPGWALSFLLRKMRITTSRVKIR